VAKKRKDYPNTSWGREARWEDEQSRIQQKISNETPREYVRTYDTVLTMRAENRTTEEIRAVLHQPPRYDPQNPPSDSHAYAIAYGLARVRLQAIEDACSGVPARHNLRG
jgi:hypothetical protein